MDLGYFLYIFLYEKSKAERYHVLYICVSVSGGGCLPDEIEDFRGARVSVLCFHVQTTFG